MEETGGCQLPKVGNSWEIDVLFWLAWAKYIYIYNCNQWWLWPSCGLVHVIYI